MIYLLIYLFIYDLFAYNRTTMLIYIALAYPILLQLHIIGCAKGYE